MADNDCSKRYDVVCIGGGLGGLAGAVRAHDMGARVLVLERSEMVGGVAAYSGGWCWVGANHLVAGDTIDATEQYLDYVQGEGRPVDRQARRTYLERAVEATRWFVEAGVPLSLVRNAPDLYAPCPGASEEGRLLECSLYGRELGEWRRRLRPSVYYRTGVKRDEIYHELASDIAGRLALADRRAESDFLTHGVGLAGGFAREALVKRKIECRLDHRVTQLVWDGSRVTGVIAEGPSGTHQIGARLGVLIATGGYGNASDAAELEDVPEFVEAAPPVVDGDGLALAETVGAAVVRGADPFVVLGVRFGDEVHPGSDVPLYSQLLESIGFPHSMIVNDRGMRFGDESYYGALIRGIRTFDGRSKRWANYPCWLIFDEEYHRRYPVGPYSPGAEYPVEIVRRETLGELAIALGV
ncbi:MAG: FAD-dependent oxidoreductase, partial [Clostridia bacterium]